MHHLHCAYACVPGSNLQELKGFYETLHGLDTCVKHNMYTCCNEFHGLERPGRAKTHQSPLASIESKRMGLCKSLSAGAGH